MFVELFLLFIKALQLLAQTVRLYPKTPDAYDVNTNIHYHNNKICARQVHTSSQAFFLKNLT